MVEKLSNKQKRVLKEMVNFTCESCHQVFEENQLQVHRKLRGVDGGKYIPSNCQILCEDCHKMRDFI